MKLSAVIITYNEEENIRQCLESVNWADEIVVVDSFSTDKTVEICKEYTNKVVQKSWEGYGPQKQFALQQASLEWVLSIDADERVTKELKQEILSSKLNKDAYYIPRKFYWLGRQLQFGGCGREKYIRLFKRLKAKFTQEPVHERVVIDGKIGYFKNHIIHRSYRNIEDYFNKFNRYSSLEAEKKFKGDKQIPFVFQVLLSILDFFNRYILKLGFLDGQPGFLWAIFSSFHRLVKYAKVWEMHSNFNFRQDYRINRIF